MAVSDDIKLRTYNDALRILEARELSSLTEAVEARRVLDSAYGPNAEAVTTCLERADWTFASLIVKGVYDPGLETGFGFRYAYAKPSDMVRLTSLCPDEYMRSPLTGEQYWDAAGYWYVDHAEIYIRYVSGGTDYGMNSGLWSEGFRELLAAHLAVECAGRLTSSDAIARKAYALKEDALSHAKSRNAMDGGTKFAPAGSWVRARGTVGSRSRIDL